MRVYVCKSGGRERAATPRRHQPLEVELSNGLRFQVEDEDGALKVRLVNGYIRIKPDCANVVVIEGRDRA